MTPTTLAIGITTTLALLALPGCGTDQPLERERDAPHARQPEPAFDDARAERALRGLAVESLAAGWIDEWIARNPGRRPIVVLANVEIDADAAIPPERLTAPIRETMLASGRVRVLDGRDLARNLRDARPEDRRFTNLKDVAPIAGEVGAHFVMLGRMALRRSYSREQARVVPHHSLDFEIVELSSGEPVWTGARRITRREEE